MKSKYIALAVLGTSLLSLSGCYDLDRESHDPYTVERPNVDGNTKEDPIVDDTKYKDINITYTVSAADSATCIKDLSNAAGTFREMVYEGYYSQYQRATNLTHDIYGGYVANNQPKHAGRSPDYNYTDGWSAYRWEDFYTSRCSEYRQLLRSFKFNKTPERYRNMFYVTRIYMAFMGLANTDTYGDMPFKEYVQARVPETNNVAYDSQKDIYDAMFRMLEQAVDSIKPNDATQYGVEGEDICYFGDWNKWLRFANTLRLRMALRISNVDPERAKQEAEAALNNQYGLMTSNADNMQTVPKYAPVNIGGLDAGGNENGLAMCSVAFNSESVMSWDLEQMYRNLSTGGKDYLIRISRKETITKQIDPRCLVCWYRGGMTAKSLAEGAESITNDFVGCKRGAQAGDDPSVSSGISMSELKYSLTRTQPKPASKELNPQYWFNYARPTVWMSYAESLFLKAEAALRGYTGADLSGSAEQYFRDGVKASMDYYMIADADAQKYINGLAVLNDGTFTLGNREKMLEAIITQKWMAVFPNGNEAWAEFRRTEYPALANQLLNNSGGSVPEGKMIKRLLYPNSENSNQWFTSHAEVQAVNTEGTRLWWDVADTNDGNGNRQQPNNFR